MRHSHAALAVCMLLIALSVPLLLTGCARGGDGTSVVPEKVLDFVVRFAGNVQDNFYYFIAIDADGDDGLDGPLPVAAGPQWYNGWGTGSFTHYVEYHQGRYELYRAELDPVLQTAAGGIISATGTPLSNDAGSAELTVLSINYGAASVTGAGMISAAGNVGFQSAGTIQLQTDASGDVVAATVVYTPAASGSRDLTLAEQTQIDTLNGGGQPLTANSLQALGINLTVGAAAAGTQTITIAPTDANINVVFTPESGPITTTAATLNANSSTATATPPIPGVQIAAADFVLAQTATIELQTSELATLIGPPYEYTDPAGGSTLRFTIDADQLGTNVSNVSINVISTTELIFDPNITLPNQNVYDGLGHLGNSYITLSLNEYRTTTNSEGLFEREEAGDNTLEGPATQLEKNAVDIVDWTITLRQLR